MRNPFRGDRVVDGPPVRIEDLSEQHLTSYLVCLEDWSSEMDEAGDHKARWYEKAKDEGLRVKLALNDDDQPIGMIQYVPIEISPAQGEGLYMILCIWVHGHDEGVGDVQGRGIGSALLTAAEDDARSLGAEGMAGWGLRLPVWMTSSWFKKHDYEAIDRVGVRELVWKPFTDAARPPSWIPVQPVAQGTAPDKVEVVGFKSGWCPAANLVYERARRASEELGTEVHFRTVDTTDRETLVRCGRSDEVLVEGKPLQRGAPPTYSKVRRKIEKRVRRKRRERKKHMTKGAGRFGVNREPKRSTGRRGANNDGGRKMADDQGNGATATIAEQLRGARDALTVKRVFGDAYERDGVTVIPVAQVGGGGGGGGGESVPSEGDGEKTEQGSGSGFGTGFGVGARPIGVYEVRDGDVRWNPAVDVTRLARGGQVLAGIIAVCVTLVLITRRITDNG